MFNFISCCCWCVICVFFLSQLLFIDCVEVGNNKKALQEAEKFLKKYPGVQCARALKALVLLRIGRDTEADSIIEKLCEEEPRDEPTLQVLTVCYKEQEECKWWSPTERS